MTISSTRPRGPTQYCTGRNSYLLVTTYIVVFLFPRVTMGHGTLYGVHLVFGGSSNTRGNKYRNNGGYFGVAQNRGHGGRGNSRGRGHHTRVLGGGGQTGANGKGYSMNGGVFTNLSFFGDYHTRRGGHCFGRFQ